MANRLRNKTAKVSFLAFQDMITAVTGVLMVVMLMLSLDLTRQAASASSSERQSLQLEVAQAQRQWATNSQTLNQLQISLGDRTNRVFVIPRRDPSGKAVVLVVLSATNGWAARAGERAPTEFKVANGRTGFKKVLDTCQPAHDRIVFYVRPSGIDHFETCRALAKQRGFAIGYDTADERRQYTLAAPGT